MEEMDEGNESRKSVKIHIEQVDDVDEDEDEEEDEATRNSKIQEAAAVKAQQKSYTNINLDLDEIRNILVASRNADHALIFGTRHIDETTDVISIDPSYTDYKIPYGVQCRMRYSEKCRTYDKQFKNEMKMLEIYQQNAYEAARFSRHLGMTTLWPPLHNHREIDKFLQKFFVHTPKDQKRLQTLLKEPQT